jgi:hypothetical protein
MRAWGPFDKLRAGSSSGKERPPQDDKLLGAGPGTGSRLSFYPALPYLNGLTTCRPSMARVCCMSSEKRTAQPDCLAERMTSASQKERL